MRIRLTDAMVAALRQTPEIPDNLLGRVNAVQQDGAGFVMTLSDDEAMAMTEMCQWYIRRDPTTGELGEHARLFDAIVNAIYDAESG